ELLEEVEQHLAARLRPAGLDEGQMARRDVGLEGEVHLRHAPALAPLAKQRAHGLAGGVHGAKRYQAIAARPITSGVIDRGALPRHDAPVATLRKGDHSCYPHCLFAPSFSSTPQ